MSIRIKLIFAFIGFTLIPSLFTTYITYNNAKAGIIENIVSRLEASASYSQTVLESMLGQKIDMFKLISSRTKLRLLLKSLADGNSSAEDLKLMEKIINDARISASEIIAGVQIYSLSGEVVASTWKSDQLRLEVGRHGNLSENLSGRNQDYIVSFFSGAQLHLIIEGPLRLNNKTIGWARVLMSNDRISQVVSSQMFDFEDTGEILLADLTPDGHIHFIVRPRFVDQESYRVAKESSFLPMTKALNKVNSVVVPDDGILDYRGHRVFAATRHIASANWGLVVKVDESEALAPLKKLTVETLVFSSLVSCLVIFTSILFGSRISNPLVSLNAYINSLSKSEEDNVIGVNSKILSSIDSDILTRGDEIGDLARSFVELTKQLFEANKMLKNSNLHLEDTNQLLDAIVENIPNMIFLKEAKDLRFVIFNKAGEDLLGIPREEIVGKNDYDFFPRDQADFFVLNDQKVLKEGKLVDIPEELISTRHKGERILHTKKIPLVNVEGNSEYLLGISEDITEMKVAENKLKEANEKLEEKVKERTEELEELLYTVSHDLKSPLVTVQGFAGILVNHLEHGDSAKIKDSISRIQNAASRMSELINDLLSLSRVGKVETFAEEVDMNSLLATVSHNVSGALVGKSIELQIDENLPRVVSNKSALIQVFENLIYNAIKYGCEEGKLNIISVGCEEVVDKYIFYVADQGPGVPIDHREKIFLLFQRLSVDQEGTGLGLAIVRKIIRKIGGRVWVEGEVGEGAIFKVSIPKIEKK